MAETNRKKTPCYFDIGNNKVIRVQLIVSNFAAGLLTALGITKGGENGEPPAGKTVVGAGKNAAILNGCFPLNLVYDVGGGKSQTARVLVAPSKADSAVTDAKAQKYRSKAIIDVRPPRRRVYVT
jgi:hypothetical protein